MATPMWALFHSQLAILLKTSIYKTGILPTGIHGPLVLLPTVMSRYTSERPRRPRLVSVVVPVDIHILTDDMVAGSGYVDAATLAGIITGTQSQYKSFGGVMLWYAASSKGWTTTLTLSFSQGRITSVSK